MKDYGNAIKVLRKRNQMTQAALAEQLNVSGQAVSKWENNLAQPDLDTVLKMAELFRVTLDEFTRLCDPDAADATPAASEAATSVAVAPVHTPEPAPILIGVCGQCGRSIYNEKDLGVRTPKMLCKACVAANDRKKKETEKQKLYAELAKKEEQYRKLRRSLIIPSIVVGAILLLLIIIAPSSWWASLLLCIFGYVITVLVRWDNNVVADVFDWTFGKTFAKPGLIIPLSLDGFIWAFCVKVAMAVIWFFLSLAVTVFGLLLCLVLLPFALPVAILRTKREIQNNEFMIFD